ncbi:MAG: NAD(P)-dependent oxidoreductase [Alkalispirochaeta sp.]
MNKPTIGAIGLGVMGGPMARRLATAYDVVAFDPDDTRLRILVAETTAAPVHSVTEAGERSDVVILSLPTTAVVEAVILGDGTSGLASVMRPGTTIIDMSTTEPDTTRRLAEELAKREIALIDAPVSGGQKGAEEGTLSIMCGGDAALVETVRPILETVGSSVVRVGPVGSGGVAKLVNNMIVGAAFTSITEGLALCAVAGIDPRDLHAAIRGGWAGSPVLDVTIDAVAAGDFRPGGTVNLLSKDLGYARNLARRSHIPIPVTAAVDEVFTAAIARGDGEKAQPVIVQMWEELLGVQISGGDVR